jgi:homocysteine S-methyltransferase
MSATGLLAGSAWVTDGGLETDLIFHRGFDLPDFASFPLVDDADGAGALASYVRDYAAVAAAAGVGVLVETPTWRANADWAAPLGYDAAALVRVNRDAVALVRRALGGADPALVSGSVGPRGDGYRVGGDDPDEAAAYHRPLVASLAAAGVDLVHAMTMTGAAEAIGVVRAARDVGVPVAISFTVETDGRLPDGRGLAATLDRLERDAPADWYGVNCAHPSHLVPALDGAAWQDRLTWFRPNASTLSHVELDELETLDEGDLDLLVGSTRGVRTAVPSIAVLGGCCGTDVRHVAALWDVPAPRSS